VARVMKLAETHLPAPAALEDAPAVLDVALDGFEFNKAMDTIWSRIQRADERITFEEPFKVVKEDPEKGRLIIGELVAEVHAIGQALAAYMPETSAAVVAAAKENRKPENLFPRLP